MAAETKKRDFITVLGILCNALPEENAEKLKNSVTSWAPEDSWKYLSNFIHNTVLPDSRDAKSIMIYSILCDKPFDAIKINFEAKGF